MHHTVKIIGYAKLSVAPDRIRLSIKVENLAKEYCEAMEYAEKAQLEMTEIIKRAEIAESELKTISWGMTAEYSYHANERNEQVRVFDGYRYRHSFMIELGMDHKTAGRILNEIVQSSLTPEIGLEYFVSDPGMYKDKLMENAVSNSRHEAEILAHAADTRLGQVVSIMYTSRGGGRVRGVENDLAVPAFLCARKIDMPELTPTNVELSESVEVEWELI